MLVKWYADSAEGKGKDECWTDEINGLIRAHIGSVMSDVRQRFLAFFWLAVRTDAFIFFSIAYEALSSKVQFSAVPRELNNLT